MKLVSHLKHFLVRLRHPLSSPEDIAETLGIYLPNTLTFEEMLQKIANPSLPLLNLKKYMSRKEVESIFRGAQRKEIFLENTRISYYFKEGWVGFSLHFDKDNHLRRLYLQHMNIKTEEGIEIPLPQ